VTTVNAEFVEAVDLTTEEMVDGYLIEKVRDGVRIEITVETADLLNAVLWNLALGKEGVALERLTDRLDEEIGRPSGGAGELAREIIGRTFIDGGSR
jgi:hypothetical protein